MIFQLVHAEARRRALQAVSDAPEGWCVKVSEPTRNLEQNAKFHALCSDLAESDLEWHGKKRTAAEWKVLLISGHSVATKQGAEIVSGIEGEFLNIRESSATMTKQRISSLIDYAQEFVSANVDGKHAEKKSSR